MNVGACAVRFAAGFLRRLAIISILWMIIVNGNASSLLVGMPVVVLATVVTLPMRSFVRIRWWEVICFIPFFFTRAFSGGMDLARRALHPRLPMNPGMIQYPLRLPQGLPRVVMVNTVNLLPGTLTVDIEAQALQVHVIDLETPVLDELEAVENAVARLFGITLDPIGR